MNYGELKDTIETVNTGALLPDNIDSVISLVLGKIARRRLPSLVRVGTITTGGATQFALGSASFCPGFLDFKLDAENQDRCIYSLRNDDTPAFFRMVNNSRFVSETRGGVTTMRGKQLNVKPYYGESIPDTLYVPYYSKFLVLDEDGITEKEKFENNDDETLIGSEFDDVIVDGVKLYIARREKNSSDFTKDLAAWNRQLDELIYFS